MKMQIELFKIAKSDLNASRILYAKKMYPQAMFYFQQSVEKANKSFGLQLGIITEAELLKFQHDPTRIYEKIYKNNKQQHEVLDKLLGQSSSSNAATIRKKLNLPKSAKQIDRLMKQIEKVRKNRENLVVLSRQEIIGLLEEIDQEVYKIKKRKFNEKEFNLFKKMILSIYDALHQFNPGKIENDKTEFAKLNHKTFGELIYRIKPWLVIFYRAYLTFFILGIITMPHAVLTRYPDADIDVSPFEIYTKRLPVVKLCPDLIKRQESALKDFRLLMKPKKRKGKRYV